MEARSRAVRGILACCLLWGWSFSLEAQAPYFDGRQQELNYPGPGRDQPEPAEETEVKIGYFGPSAPGHPLGGDIWMALQLATEEANSSGGYRNMPFRLLSSWSENPWGSGVSQLTRLVYTDKVWALIGGIDGPSTHLAEQITTKGLLALLSPVSTDKSVSQAFVPWAFSLLPSDQKQAPKLCEAIREALKAEQGPLVILSATDHDSQLAVLEFKTVLARQGASIARHMQFRPVSEDRTGIVRTIAASDPRVVLLVADALESAYMVRALRAAGSEARVFGSSTMGRTAFLEAAGKTAEGIVFPLVYESSPAREEFSRKFLSRFQAAPDYAACQAYDAMHLLVRAIRKAGLNRVRIRDALRELSGWEGCNGPVIWDTLGENTRGVTLGTVKAGRIVELQATETLFTR